MYHVCMYVCTSSAASGSAHVAGTHLFLEIWERCLLIHHL
jgi:hypothetical protein